MATPPSELLEFLRRYDEDIRALALALRDVVHEEMVPCHEYIFAMASKVVLLYGATAKVIEDGVCNIGVFRRHVNLHFPRGTELPDPAGVLRGTGKFMRHISLKNLSDLDRPEIREFLRLARTEAGIKQRGPDDTVVTRVKPKRRGPAHSP
jgi:hypothetical protein